MTRKYILTGGPGIEKSELLEELQKNGVYVIKEVASYIIERELKKEKGTLPWTDRGAFQKKVLETQIAWEHEIPSDINVAFVDRGIPDGLAYYRIDGIQPPEGLAEAVRNTRYAGVFILDPLKTYHNSEIRRENPEEASRIHQTLKEVYEELGHKPVRIPEAHLVHRAELILNRIKIENDSIRQPETRENARRSLESLSK